MRAEGPTRVCEISDADRSALTPMLKADTVPSASTVTRPIHCSISFAGLGISLIDHRPRELLYTLLQGITAEYLQTRTETKLALALRRLEVDNQAIDTMYPILLEPQRTSQSIDADTSSSAEPRVSSMFRKDPRDRVIEFSLGMLNAGSTPSSVGVHYVKYCILKVRVHASMVVWFFRELTVVVLCCRCDVVIAAVLFACFALHTRLQYDRF